jgi:hypothetical protein
VLSRGDPSGVREDDASARAIERRPLRGLRPGYQSSAQGSHIRSHFEKISWSDEIFWSILAGFARHPCYHGTMARLKLAQGFEAPAREAVPCIDLHFYLSIYIFSALRRQGRRPPRSVRRKPQLRPGQGARNNRIGRLHPPRFISPGSAFSALENLNVYQCSGPQLPAGIITIVPISRIPAAPSLTVTSRRRTDGPRFIRQSATDRPSSRYFSAFCCGRLYTTAGNAAGQLQSIFRTGGRGEPPVHNAILPGFDHRDFRSAKPSQRASQNPPQFAGQSQSIFRSPIDRILTFYQCYGSRCAISNAYQGETLGILSSYQCFGPPGAGLGPQAAAPGRLADRFG